MDQIDISELLTVRDWIRFGSTQFEKADIYLGHGTDNCWDEAAVLVLWVIKHAWQRLDHVIDARLTMAERRQVLEAFRRRVEDRLPAAYITGEANFAGLSFNVNEHVLIPRSPIAELIAKGFFPWIEEDPHTVLDLCTGSGCIGIACAYAFEDAQVCMSDISIDALNVAKSNICLHELESRITLIQSDGFKQLPDQKYDLIVSNPPYVDAQDIASMPAEYHAEPMLGLAAGDDGLNLARHILANAADYLTPDGLLVVEVGNSWEALQETFPLVPFTWVDLEDGGHGVFVLTRMQILGISQE